MKKEFDVKVESMMKSDKKVKDKKWGILRYRGVHNLSVCLLESFCIHILILFSVPF